MKTPFLQAPSTASVSDPVEGPEMTKVSKSSLNLRNHFVKKKIRIENDFFTEIIFRAIPLLGKKEWKSQKSHTWQISSLH